MRKAGLDEMMNRHHLQVSCQTLSYLGACMVEHRGALPDPPDWVQLGNYSVLLARAAATRCAAQTLVQQGMGYYSIYIDMCCRTTFQPCENDGKCATMPPLKTPSINEVQTKDTSGVGDCRPVCLLALQRCKLLAKIPSTGRGTPRRRIS